MQPGYTRLCQPDFSYRDQLHTDAPVLAIRRRYPYRPVNLPPRPPEEQDFLLETITILGQDQLSTICHAWSYYSYSGLSGTHPP